MSKRSDLVRRLHVALGERVLADANVGHIANQIDDIASRDHEALARIRVALEGPLSLVDTIEEITAAMLAAGYEVGT